MGSLIFPCPKSWEVIESGIETDEATLKKLRLCNLRVNCPHCQTTHELKIKDGYLFKMQPRRSEIHYIGLLRDEIDVGAFLQRTLARTAGPSTRTDEHPDPRPKRLV
ncbi:MAG: hypothetical protein QOG38_2290 [Hyphomicrobiales bacterium]|nr:hypothetical protein [Hyphomicrobiales bacterium]